MVARIAGRQFAEVMTLPLRQAMAAARWLEGRVHNVGKPDQPTEAKAALTEGDCVSQEVLVTALAEHFPHVALDAEEDTPAVKSFAANDSPYTVRVDPIDGTLRYLRGDGLYAIIVGLEREGLVEAALVAVPQEDVLVRAVRGGGAEVSAAGGRFSPLRLHEGGSRVLVSHGVPDEVTQRLRTGGTHVTLAAGGAIGVAPALAGTRGALRMSAEPTGVSRRGWIAALAVQEAGGVVQALAATLPERYEPGVPGLLVAASRADADGLLASL